ncbi:hypothetical protein M0802_007272 [Mischocyttarus mexicanus]|nr:hypothetical protein M0802_007272 [Mischocyttarus mexicanus]
MMVGVFRVASGLENGDEGGMVGRSVQEDRGREPSDEDRNDEPQTIALVSLADAVFSRTTQKERDIHPLLLDFPIDVIFFVPSCDSIKGKALSWAVNSLDEHLREFHKKFQNGSNVDEYPQRPESLGSLEESTSQFLCFFLPDGYVPSMLLINNPTWCVLKTCGCSKIVVVHLPRDNTTVVQPLLSTLVVRGPSLTPPPPPPSPSVAGGQDLPLKCAIFTDKVLYEESLERVGVKRRPTSRIRYHPLLR